MRSHRQIVQSYGAAALVRALAGRGIEVHASTPQRWTDRDSIPAEYWRALVDLNIATLDELSRAAEATKFPDALGMAELDQVYADPPRRPDLPPRADKASSLVRSEEARQAALHAMLHHAGWPAEGRMVSRDELHDR